ncbi:RHO1 GDP-GTP exchange protein 2, partial [Podochytrium sp. JEL0797]
MMTADHRTPLVASPTTQTNPAPFLSDHAVEPYDVSQVDADWKQLVSRLPQGSRHQKRMFHIEEIISNQTNFVKDLDALYELYYEPLINPSLDIIDSSRRWDFIFALFGPLTDLITVTKRMLYEFQDRQTQLVLRYIQSNGVHASDEDLLALVEQFMIGDVFLQNVEDFTVFEFYAANNESCRELYAHEKKRNSKFRALVEDVMSKSKTEEAIDYLTKIVKKFSDYKLNLVDVLKRMDPQTSRDFGPVEQAIEEISRIATRMNEATKLTQNQRRLQLLQNSTFPSDDLDMLNLTAPHRELIYQTPLRVVKLSGRSHEIELCLLDNFLVLFAKFDDHNPDDDEVQEIVVQNPAASFSGKRKRYLYKIYKKPMQIGNIRVVFDSDSDSLIPRLFRLNTVATTSSAHSSSSTGNTLPRNNTTNSTSDNKAFYVHDYGHFMDETHSSVYHFKVEVETLRDQWKRKIEQHQHARWLKSPMTTTLVVDSWKQSGRDSKFVDAATVGDRILVATKGAVYLGMPGSALRKTVLMKSASISMGEIITQVDVLVEFDLILVLAEGTLYSYSLAAVVNHTNLAPVRHKITSPVSFFRIGVCDGKTLICAVGDTGLRWQMKLLDPSTHKVKKSFFSTQPQTHAMQVYKDIFIPTPVTSIDFLKMRVVIGTCRGFEMVHMKLIGADGNSPLLDSTDPRLRFIRNRENLNPLALFRTNETHFLLCFQDQGFFITKNGKFAPSTPRFNWRGLEPTRFAFFAPYLVAVSRNVVDVFECESGELVQSLVAEGVSVLEVSARGIYVVREAGTGEDG